MRSRFNSKVPRPGSAAIAIGILAFALAWAGCKISPTSPEGKGEADITVTNDCGETVDITMDGDYKFTIGQKWSMEIDNVTIYEHKMEAKRPATGEIIDSGTVDVRDKTDYTWTVAHPPTIDVTNNYTQTLSIYMDGVHQFDMVVNEERWIMKVDFGEHFLTALDPATGEEKASQMLKITKNQVYYWTIVKLTT
jgi:hypothetical protein